MVVLRGQVLLPLIHALEGRHRLRTWFRSHVHLSIGLGHPLILASHALGLVACSAFLHSTELLTVSLDNLVGLNFGNCCGLDALGGPALLVRLVHVLCQVVFDGSIACELLSLWETSCSRDGCIGL